MNIEEKARELGQAIIEDPKFIAYKKARMIHDSDEELQKMLQRYEEIRNEIIIENQKSVKDEEKIKNLSNALQFLYDELMKNKVLTDFLEAKHEVDMIISKVNSIIDFYLTGGEGCSPSKCSGCSGCH